MTMAKPGAMKSLCEATAAPGTSAIRARSSGLMESWSQCTISTKRRIRSATSALRFGIPAEDSVAKPTDHPKADEQVTMKAPVEHPCPGELFQFLGQLRLTRNPVFNLPIQLQLPGRSFFKLTVQL